MRSLAIALCALAALAAAPAVAAAKPSLRVTDLRVDHMQDPLGIDDDDADAELEAALARRRRAPARLPRRRSATSAARVWDSGRVRVRRVRGVPYDGPAAAVAARAELDRARLGPPRRPVGLGEARPVRDGPARALGLARALGRRPRVARSATPIRSTIRFPARTARFLRLDVTRLGLPLQEGWPDPVSRLQLAELEAYGGGQLRSRGAAATASESYTVGGVWEPRFLTDGTLDSDSRPARLHELRAPRAGPRRTPDLARDRPRRLPATVDELRLYPRTDTLTPERRTANFPEDFTLADAHRRGGRVDRGATAPTGQAAPQPPPQPHGLPLLARSFTLDGRSAARACTPSGSASPSRA